MDRVLAAQALEVGLPSVLIVEPRIAHVELVQRQ
jgi:hypothetical protein